LFIRQGEASIILASLAGRMEKQKLPIIFFRPISDKQLNRRDFHGDS
jgi:hypothetical protein